MQLQHLPLRQGYEPDLFLRADEDNLLTLQNQVYFLKVPSDQDFVVPCKPSFPQVEVSLTQASGTEVSPEFFDKKTGYNITASETMVMFFCYGMYASALSSVDFMVQCRFGFWVQVTWKYSPQDGFAANKTLLTHTGIKICEGIYKGIRTSYFIQENDTASVSFPNNSYDIHLDEMNDIIHWVILYEGHPSIPSIKWTHNGVVLASTAAGAVHVVNDRYHINVSREDGTVILRITNPYMGDVGSHQLEACIKAVNEVCKNISFSLTVLGGPEEVKSYVQGGVKVAAVNSEVEVSCSALGNPRPTLSLLYAYCSSPSNCSAYQHIATELQINSCSGEEVSESCDGLPATAAKTSYKVHINTSGMFVCEANNTHGSVSSAEYFVAAIESSEYWEYYCLKQCFVADGCTVYTPATVSLTCQANIFHFWDKKPVIFAGHLEDCAAEKDCSGLTELGVNGANVIRFIEWSTALTHFVNVSLALDTNSEKCLCYECVLPSERGSTNEKVGRRMRIRDSVFITILTLQTDSNFGFKNISQSTKVVVVDPNARQKEILLYAVIGFSVVLGIILLVSAVLLLRFHKKRKSQEEQDFAQFIDGNEDRLTRDIGLSEQALLLPMKKEFQFPRNKLEYEKLLGSGAFGMVYRAKVRGPIRGEVHPYVAVKEVKSRSDENQLKCLVSEVKIMMHLGRHTNVVNLLGVCTENYRLGQFQIIVEYCKYGNLLNFLREKKAAFINAMNRDGTLRNRKR
ncbi:hypothetical protein HAZT_HAZT005000 [Hyalella azteca]|uniref:receptor protein-tyrosine kinase n=1 Tax=Hyalella azteca TaxID=294128 RepID=A0A6A0GTR5_HYAAZ|nr:hypothetical protein HAZT_HAZT005000 [Hyalella azteca]